MARIVSGRCRNCEPRPIFQWKASEGPKLADAHCPSCLCKLRQTAPALTMGATFIFAVPYTSAEAASARVVRGGRQPTAGLAFFREYEGDHPSHVEPLRAFCSVCGKSRLTTKVRHDGRRACAECHAEKWGEEVVWS